MPMNPEGVGSQLADGVDAIETYIEADGRLADDYRTALLNEHERADATAIREALSDISYPGALPTREFDTVDDLVREFPPAREWASHEAAGRWAERVLEGIATIATDGSELEPTDELNVPVALVQSAHYVNYHTEDRDYERAVDPQVLFPEDVVIEAGASNSSYIDTAEVGHARYTHEADTVVSIIEQFADTDPPPIVLYDGPLVVSFVNALAPDTRDRYVDAMGRVLAASRCHEVPVVGYISDTNASDVGTFVQSIQPSQFKDAPLAKDRAIFAPLMDTWGARTAVFKSRRDSSVDALETTYANDQYAFGDRMYFTYFDLGDGSALDRVEFPQWVFEADAPAGQPVDHLYEYVIDAVRAEAAVGRGYPEILQHADADAVLTPQDRERFIRMVQQLGEEEGLNIRWTTKDRSKRQRR